MRKTINWVSHCTHNGKNECSMASPTSFTNAIKIALHIDFIHQRYDWKGRKANPLDWWKVCWISFSLSAVLRLQTRRNDDDDDDGEVRETYSFIQQQLYRLLKLSEWFFFLRFSVLLHRTVRGKREWGRRRDREREGEREKEKALFFVIHSLVRP